MSTYKLYYFNGRGRAEISRLIFAAAGQKFHDIRYEESEWPTHKTEMPLGQIPVLEINGFKLPQSISIARYLAKEFHLAGKNNLEQAKVDAVADTLTDLINKFAPILWQEEDENKKKQGIKKFMTEELPKHLKNLETLGHSYSDGGHFFVGTTLKILFAENPIQLQRSELVSLINGFTQLSTSIYRLEHTFKTCLKKNTEL
ncbi:unnamed protein product [Rotaria sp. Silwood1]|nr:unnamed protein product [Rotaria sp. Silwood1]